MFLLSDDDKWTILRIATLAISSGALYGQKARDQDAKDHASTRELSNMGGSSSSSSEFHHPSHRLLRTHLKKLESDLVDIGQGFSTTGDVTKQVSTVFKKLEYHGNMLQSFCRDVLLPADASTPLPSDQINASIRGIADLVSKLKLHMPGTGHVRVESASDLINHLLKLPAYEKFAGRMALQDFEKNYRSLDSRSKCCLFCFSVFPEGFAVEKRSMMYWWVGEGLIYDAELDGYKVAEEVANEVVKKFLEFGFVEPMIENGKLVGLKMNPVIRYAVAYLAERAGFCDFDFSWNPTADFQLCGKAFLVKVEGEYSREWMMKNRDLNPRKLRTLFNVNDPRPNFETKWFSRARNVNVLCLGKFTVDGLWSTDWRCASFKNVKFLKGLKYMKHLKLLSLREVVGIHLLPDAIGKLKDLRILSLNKCLYLSALPSSIESLHRLTHLDLTESESLNSLPKEIGQLKELQVLRGFPIINSEDNNMCTLVDLAGLKKLRKLSIRRAKEAFPTAQELNALRNMRSLRKLKVEWQQGNYSLMIGTLAPSNAFPFEESRALILELPQDLEKLELVNFPQTRVPYWLVPSKLKCLKKLYIGGGNLRDLHQAEGENDRWKVKILRLKFLREFRMDWTRVEDQFPDLFYLERLECPWLTLFPCNDNGVWLNKKMPSETLLKEVGFSWSFLATGTY